MNAKLKQNRQMRSLGLALLASILAAVATMFVPASVLESITGASGLSELVPATAAPLGDTARALIAFGTGALTLALMAVLLLRQNNNAPKPDAQVVPAAGMFEDDDRNFVQSLKDRITNIRLPKMPWVKGEDDITELSDLPKLRGGDIHPDAPARRPLSATQDLPVLDLTAAEKLEPEEPVAEWAADIVSPAANVEPVEAFAEAVVVSPIPVEDIQPSLAEMVAQLEAAVSERHKQLVDLEIVAANLAAGRAEPAIASEPIAKPAPEADIFVEPVRAERPPLEVVPASPAKADDMDEALAAALATLHRMNGTDR